MPNVATIGAKITGDNVDFNRKIEEAERRAATFGGRVQANFQQAFKRTPGMRAERAFSGLFQDLASGNVAQGIEAITSRMTGFGLVAGLAIGAGVAVFIKFKEQIDAAREAFANLEGAMIKRPTSIVGSLSAEGMEQALEERQKLAAEAMKKAQGAGTGHEILEGLKSAMPFFFGGRKSEDAERISNQKVINQEALDEKQILKDQVDLMVTMNSLERTALTGDQQEARIAKIILETEQARAALKLKGLSAEQFQRADQALSDSAEMKISQERRLKESKDRSFETQKRQINLESSPGLTAEQKKGLAAGIDLASIQKGLANPDLSKDERQNLILQKMRKESDLGIMPGTVAFGSGEWWRRKQGGESANSQEALSKLGLNPADIQKQTGNLPGTEGGTPAIVAGITKTNDLLQQIFLTPAPTK